MIEFFRNLMAGLRGEAPGQVAPLPVRSLTPEAPAPATPSWPSPATADIPVSGPAAAIGLLSIQLGQSRDTAATLTAFDTSGNPMFSSGSVVTRSGSMLAQRNGNPGRDPLLRYGDTPTGSYVVDEVIPAHGDVTGVAMFGPHRSLRLRPVSGDAALADANGRTALLIHGGPVGKSTDGSIRVPDVCMLKILARIPSGPDAAPAPVQVEVLAAVAAAADAGGGSYATASAYGIYDDTGDTGDAVLQMLSAYYDQMYLWDLQQGCQPGTAFLEQPCQQPDGSWNSDPGHASDQDAAAALAGLGYGVVADQSQQQPVPDMAATPAAGAPADVQPAPSEHGPAHNVADTAAAGSDPGFMPYFPVAAPDSTDTSSWQPDGGAYGR